MIRVCMVCVKVFGEKEPLDDKSPTHGICHSCFEGIKAKYENQKERWRRKAGELNDLERNERGPIKIRRRK